MVSPAAVLRWVPGQGESTQECSQINMHKENNNGEITHPRGVPVLTTGVPEGDLQFWLTGSQAVKKPESSHKVICWASVSLSIYYATWKEKSCEKRNYNQ